jgi:hypothetical protein
MRVQLSPESKLDTHTCYAEYLEDARSCVCTIALLELLILKTVSIQGHPKGCSHISKITALELCPWSKDHSPLSALQVKDDPNFR